MSTCKQELAIALNVLFDNLVNHAFGDVVENKDLWGFSQ
jgi:hypothetical protein